MAKRRREAKGLQGTDEELQMQCEPLVLQFEAALYERGTCWQIDGGQESKLTLSIDASNALELAVAIAKGYLHNRTFRVQITID